MAYPTHARLAGQRVALSGKTGAFRVCPVCGSCEGKIGTAPSPHAASLHCTACQSPIGWLSQAHLDALAAGLPRGGVRRAG